MVTCVGAGPVSGDDAGAGPTGFGDFELAAAPQDPDFGLRFGSGALLFERLFLNFGAAQGEKWKSTYRC